MATQNEQLRILISVDQAGNVSAQLRGIEERFTQTGNAARRAGGGLSSFQAGVITMNQALNLAHTSLLRAGEAFSAFTDRADTANLLAARIGLVTSSTEELTEVQTRLFAISQETRTDFEANVTLYTRLARGVEDLHLSQDKLLLVTSNLNKAIIVSGATSIEATQGLIQLSQAMARGVLRGDELRSIMEQLPGVGKLIAREFGVTTGELAKLGEQGALTVDRLISAFAGAPETLAEEFKRIPLTVGQAFTTLRNESLKAVGEIDKASGASRALADSLVAVREAADRNLPTVVEHVREIANVASENRGAISGALGGLTLGAGAVALPALLRGIGIAFRFAFGGVGPMASAAAIGIGTVGTATLVLLGHLKDLQRIIDQGRTDALDLQLRYEELARGQRMAAAAGIEFTDAMREQILSGKLASQVIREEEERLDRLANSGNKAAKAIAAFAQSFALAGTAAGRVSRAIEEAKQALDEGIGAGQGITIKAEVEIREAEAALERFRNFIETIKDEELRIRAEVQADNLEEDIKRMRADAQARIDAQGPLTGPQIDFATEFRRAEDEADDLLNDLRASLQSSGGKLDLGVRLSLENAKSFAERIQKDIDAEDDPVQKVKLEALLDDFNKDVEKAKAPIEKPVIFRGDAQKFLVETAAMRDALAAKGIVVPLRLDQAIARGDLTAFQRDQLIAQGIKLPIRAETADARDKILGLKNEVEQGATMPITANINGALDNIGQLFDEFDARVAKMFKGLDAAKLNTVRHVELDFPDARAIASSVQLAIEVARVTGNVGDLENAFKAALEAQARLQQAAAGTSPGTGFLEFFVAEANRATAAVNAARQALAQFQQASQSVQPITVPVEASGSPSRPFTEYFREHAPKVVREFVTKPVPEVIDIRTTGAGGKNGARPAVAAPEHENGSGRLTEILEDIKISNAQIAAKIDGRRFAVSTAKNIESERRRSGDRNYSLIGG